MPATFSIAGARNRGQGPLLPQATSQTSQTSKTSKTSETNKTNQIELIRKK